ncbi:MAG TPA: histidine kinase [Gemmatimonadales bacterium]|jgi:two-component system sensor histidine kinase KdpD
MTRHRALLAADSSFADLVQTRRRGRFKVYVGFAAGTGKTYRMLVEAHQLKQRGVDVVIGLVETHGRVETDAQLHDLEVVPRRRASYRGVLLDEMDLAAVVARQPQVVVVDELAHTNVPGAAHAKRWEDVVALLDQGISVISAVNVQHLESLNDILQQTLGVTVRETVPDWVVGLAEQVINLDISTEDLRQRLLDGKIYVADKIAAALTGFFTEDNLATLRELALREVASAVDRERRDNPLTSGASRIPSVDRLMVAMSSRGTDASVLLRKASRIAGRLNRDWYCVYVQTPDEHVTRIDAATQRELLENIERAQRMGAEVVKLVDADVPGALRTFARERGVTLLIVGQPRRSWWQHLWRPPVIRSLLANRSGLDILVVSPPAEPAA